MCYTYFLYELIVVSHMYCIIVYTVCMFVHCFVLWAGCLISLNKLTYFLTNGLLSILMENVTCRMLF